MQQETQTRLTTSQVADTRRKELVVLFHGTSLAGSSDEGEVVAKVLGLGFGGAVGHWKAGCHDESGFCWAGNVGNVVVVVIVDDGARYLLVAVVVMLTPRLAKVYFASKYLAVHWESSHPSASVPSKKKPTKQATKVKNEFAMARWKEERKAGIHGGWSEELRRRRLQMAQSSAVAIGPWQTALAPVGLSDSC